MGSSTLCVAFAFLRYPRVQAFEPIVGGGSGGRAGADNEREAQDRCLKHSLASKAMFGLSTGADREGKDGALSGMRRQVLPAHREAR